MLHGLDSKTDASAFMVSYGSGCAFESEPPPPIPLTPPAPSDSFNMTFSSSSDDSISNCWCCCSWVNMLTGLTLGGAVVAACTTSIVAATAPLGVAVFFDLEGRVATTRLGGGGGNAGSRCICIYGRAAMQKHLAAAR